MATKFNWDSLLCRSRIGGVAEGVGHGRDDFLKDFDTIIFSSAFRRLQDKTQVFPLAKNDYVRTRLTHSLEVASVGRSLGTLVGREVLPKSRLDATEADFGVIVASACLLHDIGNPPFGHTGEDAIQEWFRSENAKHVLDVISEEMHQDFLRFEGNAQGFRVATRLHDPDNNGMGLTAATLAASIKYPQSAFARSQLAGGNKKCSQKKHNYFLDDQESFQFVVNSCGINNEGVARHPFAFLVEAADDICYHVMDIEDGFRTGCLEFDVVNKTLLQLANAAARSKEVKSLPVDLKDRHKRERWISSLRGAAINNCINHVKSTFVDNMEKLLNGEFDEPLVDATSDIADAMKECTALCERSVYPSRAVAGVETLGYRVLWELLDLFVPAVVKRSTQAGALTLKDSTLVYLLPEQFRNSTNPYKAVLGITDYISGMTDSYAMGVYKDVTGVG